MTILLYVHPNGEEAYLMEVDHLPEPTDTCIVGMHPRRRDDKPVPLFQDNVNKIILPMSRINFIEVMPSAEDEDIFMPFRKE